MRGIFVTGTDTEVGKTYQACKLAQALADRYAIGVYKPAASGISADEASDPELLAQAANVAHRIGEDYLNRVCPQTFELPLAPPVAAELAGTEVDEKLIRDGVDWWKGNCEFLIVEGVGGLLCPLSKSLTVLDFARSIDFPLLVVAANRLGVVNHTLLTVELAKRSGLTVKGVILNEMHRKDPSDISAQTNRKLLADWLPGTPIFSSAEELAELL